MRKYNVALSNDSCIFDEASGFDSIFDVIQWASGRGGRYVIQLDAGKAEQGESISIAYDSDTKSFSHYDGWEFVAIPADKLEAYIRQYI